MSKYTDKANDSFKTKWKLFCFACIIGEQNQFDLATFKTFEISDDLIKIFATEYRQYEHESELSSIKLKVNYIYTKLNELDKNEIKEPCRQYYLANFESILPKESFNKLIKADECYYCETSKSEFDKLYDKHKIFKKAERGWKFEIDRKEPNKEYFKNNCVIACYWCNNAKTDEFNAEEFKSIGLLIGETLRNRLKNDN